MRQFGKLHCGIENRIDEALILTYLIFIFPLQPDCTANWSIQPTTYIGGLYLFHTAIAQRSWGMFGGHPPSQSPKNTRKKGTHFYYSPVFLASLVHTRGVVVKSVCTHYLYSMCLWVCTICGYVWHGYRFFFRLWHVCCTFVWFAPKYRLCFMGTIFWYSI